MDWSSLIRPYRLGCDKEGFDGIKGRSEFHRDFDRIVFSSAFRRLNGETQVVPFPDSDLTHTRLTHSLESASVARSLGNLVQEEIDELRDSAYDIGALLAATCLCHDIGNPPLGHSGESAIQYFLSQRKEESISMSCQSCNKPISCILTVMPWAFTCSLITTRIKLKTLEA